MMHAELQALFASWEKDGVINLLTLYWKRSLAKQSISIKKKRLLNWSGRYFKGRGPATVKDFSTWSGLTIKECTQGC
jgi:hypothetical protein